MPISNHVCAAVGLFWTQMVWVMGRFHSRVNTADDSVSRVDPTTDAVSATINVGQAPFGIASGAGAVWVANQNGNSVSRIDPSTNRVSATIAVGMLPIGVAITPGAVWVADHHSDS
jgi:YVTN family beta-propeller protein